MFRPPQAATPPSGEAQVPATRSFVVTRYAIKGDDQHQFRMSQEVINEVIPGHNIAVENGGVVAIVEMVDVGEGRALLQYRAIFAPGEFVCIREERLMAPSMLVEP